MLLRPLLVLLALAAASVPASAQMLPSGTWAGTLSTTREQSVPVRAELERCEGGFTLALVSGRTRSDAGTATWDDGRLRFRAPAMRVPDRRTRTAIACDLRPQADGALAGTCTAGRTAYRLRLAPPAGGAFGCD